MALLDDVRVVDLSVARGQLCARVLADLGADVVRVVAADADPPTLSNVYRNANKRVLTLDLHDARARDRLHELLRGADLLVESFDPGELAAIDDALDPVALATRYPHLVVTSITAFGLTGPYRDHASSELVLQAVGGSLFRAGSAARPPCAAPGSYASDIAGATAALGSLLALRQARASGRGQHIDVAAIEALAHCTDWALPLWSVLGTDQQRAGAPLYPLFPCADGLVRLVLPMTMRDWWSLYHWLDAPELAGRTPTFPGMPVEERQFVCDLVARAFAGRTRMDLTRAALDAGVAVTPVLLPGEVLTNEHAVSRGLGIDIGLPDGRRGLAPAGFYSVDGERAGIRTPATPITAAPDWTPRPAPVEATRTAGRPLAGVRVLDFGIGGVGPECGRLLAEWGADVIKIESASRPDFQRKVLGGDMNATFASSNRAKRGLGFDLATADGRELLLRLVPSVDVVVENMATGVMDRLGLGYPTLRERNPRLVMASSQLLGDRGAWSHWKGYGPSARAIGGLTWLWEHPAVERREGVSTIHPDHFAGRLLALATVAALHARDRTGAGCHVDMAQAEVVVGLLGDLFLAESLQPGSVGPVGNASDAGAPWGAYRCRDDGTTESWVAICVRTDDEWRALRKIMGEPAWSLADRFETTAGRQGARDELDASLNAWTATRENREVMRELQAAGVPAGALLHPRTQMDDPHFQARDFFRIIEQPGTGRVIVDGPAFHGAALGEPDIRPAPLPGEHTREICRDDLGLDDAEIAALIERGVIDAAAAPPVL